MVETTVSDTLLKWLRHREKEVGGESPDKELYQKSLWFPMKNCANTDHIRKTRRRKS